MCLWTKLNCDSQFKFFTANSRNLLRMQYYDAVCSVCASDQLFLLRVTGYMYFCQKFKKKNSEIYFKPDFLEIFYLPQYLVRGIPITVQCKHCRVQ